MQHHRTSRALAGTLLAFLLLPMTPIAAMPSMSGASRRLGRISGKVTDGRSEAIPDVKITITTKSNSSFKKVLTTAKDGSWATFLNDATLTFHYLFEKPGYMAVEKDRKVPLWNPNDSSEPNGTRSEDFSVLDIQLIAQAAAVENGR
jgi:hypothetical protein